MAEDPIVGLVGTGPATEAIEEATADLPVDVSRIDPGEAASVGAVAVVGPSGAEVFDRVNNHTTGPWIAVELGGIGGVSVRDVDAGISVLETTTQCFSCLRHRVLANVDDPNDTPDPIPPSDARLAGAIAGHLIAVSQRDEWPRGRVIELPYSERFLHPVPHCRCADTTSSTGLSRDYSQVSLETTVDMADTAIDDRLGLVTTVGEAYSFPLPYYLATLCDTTAFSDAQASRQAAGVAADWNEAFIKAIGEALERYSAGVYRETTFDEFTVEQQDGVVSPERFVLPSEPPADEAIPWVPGQDLGSRTAVYLPAEFVYFPPPERTHKPPITTGLGLGSSPVMALLSGLYEVIERDATMLAWYSTYDPLRLEVDDPEYETLAKRARAENLDTTAVLVTQDIDVPVVTAAVYRESDWPRFAVGSGANFNPSRAARSALGEALQNWMELRGMGPEAAQDEGNIGRYADAPPEVHGLLEANRSVSIDQVGPSQMPKGKEELSAVIDRVLETGLDVYAARITPRDVESIGFETVRVLIPEAQPLFTGDAFFGDRARQVPRDLGFTPRLDRAIHPYP